MAELHPGICDLCDATCGIEIEHQGRRILNIRGDKKDPLSRGHICPKAVAVKDLYEDPDRLRAPMRRIGKRWETLDWNAALDEVTSRIVDLQRQHGPESFGCYFGNPMAHSYQAMLGLLAFARYSGTPNVFSSSRHDDRG